MTTTKLSAKENALFKLILKFYEHKQYKKGLKAAEQILKKSPEHGETLAMKGLFLSHLDRKEEAHQFIKLGLRQDLKSHICWHVYGLLHRGEKNYEEAIKCYAHALKYDKENMQIIRDFSLLQIHMRNYEGFVETRHQLLSLKPSNKMFWIGLALGYHLLGRYDTALNILTSFEETLDRPAGAIDYDHSEMLLYKNMIIKESGDYDAAFDHIEKIKDQVVDKFALNEAKAEILLLKQESEKAESVYKWLFTQNIDCKEYLLGIEKARNVEKQEDLFSLYQELRAEFPKSQLISRLILSHVSDEGFGDEFKSYLKPLLLKGVPALFVKELYQIKNRPNLIESVALEFYENLKSIQKFSHEDDDSAPPTALAWTMYFLAQHYDAIGNTTKALEFITHVEQHSPTMVEIYMIKAKIYKHAGNLSLAAEAMNFARELDLQDRFVNSKCTKYLLRKNSVQEAIDTIGLFTKHDSSDTLADLKDMQCMWFIQESGDAYSRLARKRAISAKFDENAAGKALKAYFQIESIFQDIYDDQFDFHNYCLRKSTIRDYIRMLTFEEEVIKNGKHYFFEKAALNGLGLFLFLLNDYESVEKFGPRNPNDLDMESLSLSEKKKLARKQRKAEQQKAAIATNSTEKKNVDLDPNGAKFVDFKKKENLIKDMVTKFLEPLKKSNSNNIKVWNLGAEYYLLLEKFVLAWKSLKTAYKLNKNDPEMLRQAVKFNQIVASKITSLPQPVQNVLNQEFKNHPLFQLKPTKVKGYSPKESAAHGSKSYQIVLQNLIAPNLSTLIATPLLKAVDSLINDLDLVEEGYNLFKFITNHKFYNINNSPKSKGLLITLNDVEYGYWLLFSSPLAAFVKKTGKEAEFSDLKSKFCTLCQEDFNHASFDDVFV